MKRKGKKPAAARKKKAPATVKTPKSEDAKKLLIEAILKGVRAKLEKQSISFLVNTIIGLDTD